MIKFTGSTPIIEIMGGTGYWTYCLQKLGFGDVVCTDSLDSDGWNITESKQWTPIKKMIASDAVSKYSDRTVLVSWVPYTPPHEFLRAEAEPDKDAITMLEQMNIDQKIILIGEGSGGCTASDEFFDILDKKFTNVGYGKWVSAQGIHDCMDFFIKTK